MVCWITPLLHYCPSSRCYDEKIKVHRPVLKIPMLIHLFNRYLIRNTPSHVLATLLMLELRADKNKAPSLMPHEPR